MKITYLGTGASEGVPSLFCRCDLCKYALKKGGKEIRTRAGFLINDDLMIDYSADTFSHIIANKFDLSAIKHILITHSHEDHYYLPDLIMRTVSNVAERKEEYVTVYGNQAVMNKYNVASAPIPELTCLAKEFPTGAEVQLGEYKIKSFKTRHIQKEDSLIYLIEYEGKTYLHLLDSDYPNEEVFEYLKENQIKLDCVSADCTFGNMKDEYFGHMNVWQNVRVKQRLEEIGVLNENSKYVLTHISHYCKDTYDTLNETAQKYGMLLSYDGMVVEL